MANETRLMSGSLRLAQLDGAFSGEDNTSAIYHNTDGKLYWKVASGEAKKFISAEDVSGSISAQVAILTASIQNVDQESQDADASLTTRLASEEVARSTADSSIIVAMGAADTTLQSNIDTEASTRSTADASLTTRLAAEESARSTADSSLVVVINALQADVDQNESDSDDAEASLTTRLAAEEVARSTADSSIIVAMGAADTTLQNNINALSSSVNEDFSDATTDRAAIRSEFSTADASLTTRLAAEESARSTADSSLVVVINALQADVDQNESDSDDAEASLTTRLAAEESARSTADSSIIVAMGAADLTLQNNIDALSSSVDADRFDLRGNNTAEGNTIFNGFVRVQGSGDFNGGVTADTMVVEDLTSGRVVLAGTGGEIEDSANFTFDGSELSLVGDMAMNGDMTLEEEHFVKAGSFVTYSDATLKTNIQTMDNALDKVMSMRGVTYNFKSREDINEVGFLAQEMKQTVPEVVYGNGDGNLGIDYAKITSVLVEAVKAQQAQIEELKDLLKK